MCAIIIIIILVEPCMALMSGTVPPSLLVLHCLKACLKIMRRILETWGKGGSVMTQYSVRPRNRENTDFTKKNRVHVNRKQTDASRTQYIKPINSS